MRTPPDGPDPADAITGSELRRDVSVWGSYMWGYAAVGADIYTALGIITLAALGLAPLAFLAAGIVFALVGLCYAEMASSYPLAGVGQYFTLRGLGDLSGLIAGAALVLDYTIDISLFTVVALGYFNYFLPLITFGHHATDFTISLGTPFGPVHLAWLWLLESVAGIVLLIWLNVRGIKVSTNFNEIIGTIAIFAQSVIVVAGFVLVWKPEIVANQMLYNRPTLSQFAFGSSLAIIAFVGLETISQVAQETRRPATIIPRTSIGLVISVIVFGGIAMLQTIFAFFTPGQPGKTAAIDVLADLYAFGATTGYLFVFISLFVLRFKDPFTPRPYKMPLNIRVTYKGNQVWFPVLGLLGLLGVLFFLILVLLTHHYARIVGPLWVVAAIVLFAMYRRRRGLPIFKTLPRDWEGATKKVLLEAEEFQSLEEYEAALSEHRARTSGQQS